MAAFGLFGSAVGDLSWEFSQANSEVTLAAFGVRCTSETEKYRCLVSDEGKVQDLRGIDY
jgi:hypothetical protein